MSEENEDVTFIPIPVIRNERISDDFVVNSAIQFERDKKDNYVEELGREQSKTPFRRSKFDAPGREILYWAMAIGLMNDNPVELRNGSNTVPPDVFEKSKYCFWLGRICSIIKNENVPSMFDQNLVRNAVQEYANGGIKDFYDYTLGEHVGVGIDFEAGLINLINENLEETKNILAKYCPTDENREESAPTESTQE